MANPIVEGGYASPLSIYQTTTTRGLHKIGSRATLDDRVFYFGSLSNATGVVSNNLCQSAIPVANHVTETGATTGLVAGSTRVTLTLGATAAIENQYEEGYLTIESSTLGLGQIRKIRGGHAAVLSGGVITLDLYDPLNITPTGTVTWTLLANPYSNFIITPVTTITGTLVGVPQVAIPAAASTTAPVYAWLQTWGPTSVLKDASTLVVGQGVIASATVGAVGVAVETDIKQRVGIAMGGIATSAVYANVFLQIAP
jgi:hypothetical protein